MIRYTTGDILSAHADALVNTVNCVGIMGRGIALQFKNAFPSNFETYAAACSRGEVQPGKMLVVETGQFSPKWIINFPTKRHWKGNSKIGDIAAGLMDLRRVVLNLDIRSIAVPPLGSGLGGLEWSEVRLLIERELTGFDGVEVIVYEPLANSDLRRHVAAAKPPHMTAGRAALVSLVTRYLEGLLDPAVTLLEVHKLMYFMQGAGEPLRLRFEKAHYGPYASNLRHVLHAIEGYYVSGYMDGGDDPEKPLTLVPGAFEEAQAFLDDVGETQRRLRRVSTLVEGFEAPFGMELLATVHWVVQQDGAASISETISRVHSWNQRKRSFTPRQIEIAFQRLADQHWFGAHALA